MSNTTATLLGALLGGVIGIAGTYLGAIYSFKRQVFVDAARRFRFAFHDELAELDDPSSTTDTYQILQKAFKNHSIAVIELRYALPWWRVAGFDKAWREYHCHREANTHFLEQYSAAGQSIDESKRRKCLAVKRLKHLLSFARP